MANMKQAFERNGKLVENTSGFFNGGLTSEGVKIAEEMEESGQTGRIESNLYWVSDDYDFDADEE
jgi:hypothetical protein